MLPGELIAVQADLERTRSELTALQLKWVSELEQQAAFYQETSEKLAEIAKFLLQPESSLSPQNRIRRIGHDLAHAGG